MTFGPGRQVWERFGHNAIWIHDPVDGTDQAYNYGLFDFHQQNFLLRFVRGQMWYWMAGFPAQRVRRPVRARQPLGLGPGARARRRAPRCSCRSSSAGTPSRSTASTTTTTTGTTARPGSGTRIDGCSAAPSAARPTRFPPAPPTGSIPSDSPPTTRSSSRHCWPRWAAGGPPISAWDEMFLPLKMRERVRTVTVPGPDGTRVPLVRSERTIFESSAPPPPDAPPDWLRWYLLLGVAHRRRRAAAGPTRAQPPPPRGSGFWS